MAIFFYDVIGLSYIELTDGMTFGRSKGDVNFPDDTRMSSLHLKIHITGTKEAPLVSVEDLNSKNRTMVDRTEIEPEKPVKLMKNSVVEAGDRKFLLTEVKTLDIHKINDLLERVESRQVIRLEGRKMIQGIQEKVLKQVSELQAEQKIIKSSIDELEQKVKDENDKIKQIDVMKAEFVKKQEEDRRIYFENMDGKISGFRETINTFTGEKNKLQDQFNVLEDQIQQKASRVKKDGV